MKALILFALCASVALGAEELPDETAARAAAETERAMLDREAYRRDPKLAQHRAVQIYPDLGITGSPMHREFVQRVKHYRARQPHLFKDVTWPLVLAQETDRALRVPGALALVQTPPKQAARGALDRDEGDLPARAEDGSIPEIDRRIRRWLKDPESLIYEGWELSKGQSRGGNPAWVVRVTYRAKNSYGGYNGNSTDTYWLAPQGDWRQIPGAR
jgi:hypothetical protein